MAATFHVNILTPDAVVFSGEAVSLVVPAERGYLGVLAHHAPLVAALGSGSVIVKDPAGSTTAFHAGGAGFLEVSRNQATLLLDEIKKLTSL